MGSPGRVLALCKKRVKGSMEVVGDFEERSEEHHGDLKIHSGIC